jgi:hypothetical protein
MLILTLVLLSCAAIALALGRLLTRPRARKPLAAVEVSPMRAALERRMREGADLRL